MFWKPTQNKCKKGQITDGNKHPDKRNEIRDECENNGWTDAQQWWWKQPDKTNTRAAAHTADLYEGMQSSGPSDGAAAAMRGAEAAWVLLEHHRKRMDGVRDALWHCPKMSAAACMRDFDARVGMCMQRLAPGRWQSTDEAKVKPDTYSCKTGSLRDQDGRPQRTGLTPRAHTHRVTMWGGWGVGGWPTGNERNTVRWAKRREQKTAGSYRRSVLTRREHEWHRLWSRGSHHRRRMRNSGSVVLVSVLILYHHMTAQYFKEGKSIRKCTSECILKFYL